jgi:hypothetical protein
MEISDKEKIEEISVILKKSIEEISVIWKKSIKSGMKGIQSLDG